jgi:hypothetical protein
MIGRPMHEDRRAGGVFQPPHGGTIRIPDFSGGDLLQSSVGATAAKHADSDRRFVEILASFGASAAA